MATIKENAKKNATEFVGYNDTLRAGFESGYVIGATDYIGKACEWLREHRCDWDETALGCSLFEQSFRKAMKGESDESTTNVG